MFRPRREFVAAFPNLETSVFCIPWTTVASTVLPLFLTISATAAQQGAKPAPADPDAPRAARVSGQAQDTPKTQEQLIKLRNETFALDVFKRAPWTFDYDAARQDAKKSGKPILVYFTRSYSPCPPCTSFEKSVLSDTAFAEFAQQVVLFCHVTTMVEGDKYQELLREKGGRLFPHVVFLDADGKVLANQKDRTVAGFQRALQGIAAYDALLQKVTAGDSSRAAELLQTGVEMGRVDFAAAKELAAKFGKLADDEQKKVDAALLNLEVADVMTRVRTQEQAAAAGRTFAKMMGEGRIPTGSAARNFYAVMLTTMEADKDAAGFEKVLAAYKKLIENEPRGPRVIEDLEARLKKLQSGG